MKKIPLTQGKFALVDDEDFEYLNQFKWFAQKDKLDFYACRQIKVEKGKQRQTKVSMSRDIMKPSKGMQVDHIDGNGLNNQRTNLRICTNAENTKNKEKHKKSKSGFKGVQHNPKKCKKQWEVYIRCNYKSIYVGSYLSREEAAHAYDEAAKKYFGEFACLNFPEGV